MLGQVGRGLRFPGERLLAPPDIIQVTTVSAEVTWYVKYPEWLRVNTIIRGLIIGPVIDCVLGHNTGGGTMARYQVVLTYCISRIQPARKFNDTKNN